MKRKQPTYIVCRIIRYGFCGTWVRGAPRAEDQGIEVEDEHQVSGWLAAHHLRRQLGSGYSVIRETKDTVYVY
jgi:hypothetical protein